MSTTDIQTLQKRITVIHTKYLDAWSNYCMTQLPRYKHLAEQYWVEKLDLKALLEKQTAPVKKPKRR